MIDSIYSCSNCVTRKKVCFKLRSSITFFYSSKLLIHHQTCNLPCLPEDDMFINFGSYGIEYLYSYIIISFERNATK